VARWRIGALELLLLLVAEDSRVKLEDLCHLVGATAEAADATYEAGVELEMDACNPRRRQDA